MIEIDPSMSWDEFISRPETDYRTDNLITEQDHFKQVAQEVAAWLLEAKN